MSPLVFTANSYGSIIGQTYCAIDGPANDDHIYMSGFDPTTVDMILLKIDYNGVVVDNFTIPPSGGWAGQLIIGSDGNLWMNNPRTGYTPATMQINTSTGAVVATIPSPTVNDNFSTQPVIPGPDGAIWSLLMGLTNDTGIITQTTLAGVQSTWTVTAPSGNPFGVAPTSLCVGPDGNIWAGDRDVSRSDYTLWRITTAGVVTGFAPSPSSVPYVYSLISASDGYLWGGINSGEIAKFDTTGALVSSYTINSLDWFLCITEHPTTHNLWLVDDNYGDIYEVDLTGAVVNYYPAAVDVVNSGPYSIIIDKTGGVWVFNSNGSMGPSYVYLYKLGPGGSQLVMVL